MNKKDAELIYDFLSSQGSQGCGYLSMSNAIGIQPTTLHKYLRRYSEFFVAVGDSSHYRIKSRAEFDGSKQSMLDILTAKKRNKVLLWSMMMVSISLSVISILPLVLK